ncbi:MAG TPA: hypothetical protein VKX30_01300 [Flavobacteriaceae bacterium]|nr:hypothetical protein [Flavobacteriaceae bacterium]
MHTILFLDFLPNDLSTIIIIAIVLFVVAILWSLRTSKNQKRRKSRSFKERYYQKREENE